MARSKKIAFENRDKYIMMGLNIAYYRKLAGLTQEQLAEKVDISRSYLGDIEAPNTVTAISLELLFCIADAIKTTASKLLEFRE